MCSCTRRAARGELRCADARARAARVAARAAGRRCSAIASVSWRRLTLARASQSTIQVEGFRSLAEGAIVEYRPLTSEDGRLKATDVTGPGRTTPEVRPALLRILLVMQNGRAARGGGGAVPAQHAALRAASSPRAPAAPPAPTQTPRHASHESARAAGDAKAAVI